MGRIVSRKMTKLLVVRPNKWKILTVSHNKIPIHNSVHFRDCQDCLLGLFVSCHMADVPYFTLFSSRKVVRDPQALKMCFAMLWKLILNF